MKRIFLAAIFLPTILVLSLIGCELIDNRGFIDQNLQGEIQGIDFVFKSGFAKTHLTDNSLWSVRLFKDDPEAGYDPWEDGAYDGSLPYVSFYIEKASSAQTYAVTTFGAPANGHEGIMLTGWVTDFSGSIFDDGELEITEIDTIGLTISGRIWAVTDEGTSERAQRHLHGCARSRIGIATVASLAALGTAFETELVSHSV